MTGRSPAFPARCPERGVRQRPGEPAGGALPEAAGMERGPCRGTKGSGASASARRRCPLFAVPGTCAGLWAGFSGTDRPGHAGGRNMRGVFVLF